MKRNAIIGGIVAIIVALMVYASTKAPGAGIVGGKSGQTAPDFELKDLNGRPVHLSDFRGKAVVLNFWATWCPPCKEEIPWFIDLQKKYGPQGLQIVGVSMDDGGRDAVAPFAREMGINYTVLLGTDTVGDLYGGVHALPTTFYIGRDGKITEYAPGLISHYGVERNIKEALATNPPATGETARR